MFNPYRPSFCWQNTHHLITAFHDLSENERGRDNSLTTFIGPWSSPTSVTAAGRNLPAHWDSLELQGVAWQSGPGSCLPHLAFVSLNQGTREIMGHIILGLSSEATPFAPREGRQRCVHS